MTTSSSVQRLTISSSDLNLTRWNGENSLEEKIRIALHSLLFLGVLLAIGFGGSTNLVSEDAGAGTALFLFAAGAAIFAVFQLVLLSVTLLFARRKKTYREAHAPILLQALADKGLTVVEKNPLKILANDSCYIVKDETGTEYRSSRPCSDSEEDAWKVIFKYDLKY